MSLIIWLILSTVLFMFTIAFARVLAKKYGDNFDKWPIRIKVELNFYWGSFLIVFLGGGIYLFFMGVK